MFIVAPQIHVSLWTFLSILSAESIIFNIANISLLNPLMVWICKMDWVEGFFELDRLSSKSFLEIVANYLYWIKMVLFWYILHDDLTDTWSWFSG